MGNPFRRVTALITLVVAAFVCAAILDAPSGRAWTAASLFSILLGVALRALSAFVGPDHRGRSVVLLGYLASAAYAASALAGIGAVLAESLVPAIFLIPAALGMAVLCLLAARTAVHELRP